jgi:hypothetical protein
MYALRQKKKLSIEHMIHRTRARQQHLEMREYYGSPSCDGQASVINHKNYKQFVQKCIRFVLALR